LELYWNPIDSACHPMLGFNNSNNNNNNSTHSLVGASQRLAIEVRIPKL